MRKSWMRKSWMRKSWMRKSWMRKLQVWRPAGVYGAWAVLMVSGTARGAAGPFTAPCGRAAPYPVRGRTPRRASDGDSAVRGCQVVSRAGQRAPAPFTALCGLLAAPGARGLALRQAAGGALGPSLAAAGGIGMRWVLGRWAPLVRGLGRVVRKSLGTGIGLLIMASCLLGSVLVPARELRVLFCGAGGSLVRAGVPVLGRRSSRGRRGRALACPGLG